MTDGDADLDSRILCPDGTCVGTIGQDGRCKECGAVADPHVPSPMAPLAGDSEAESDDLCDFGERELCSDGACIGVLGADRTCKLCGKPG